MTDGVLTYRGDINGALSAILTNPPYGEGVDQAKVGGSDLDKSARSTLHASLAGCSEEWCDLDLPRHLQMKLA